mmetsp:Transcript_19637/g.50309  ORF Transcript_19637/g.50309 Transcript_19637/m.50309 type:complete len:98 (+) Transcript_19637:587-880(+)
MTTRTRVMSRKRGGVWANATSSALYCIIGVASALYRHCGRIDVFELACCNCSLCARRYALQRAAKRRALTQIGGFKEGVHRCKRVSLLSSLNSSRQF